jgi:hypothetical protein
MIIADKASKSDLSNVVSGDLSGGQISLKINELHRVSHRAACPYARQPS